MDLSEIYELIWPFIWDSRIETVSRLACHQSFTKGGIGIINVQIKGDSLKLASTDFNGCNTDSKSFFLRNIS